MLLIAGLGNPGQKYQNTWHNLGRLAVINWQKESGFPEFRLERKFNSLISKGVFDKKEILLALPETFMNKSGQALGKIISFYKIKAVNLIVVHDDADLKKGEIRVSRNRGTAGHKGLNSIVGVLKTRSFVRIRIGVRPKNYVPGSKSLDRFVLKKFTKDEEKIAAEVIKKTNEAIEMILEEGSEKAMAKFN
ncbi:MAG: aminoacyl-tRNA hydrolase [bacterium]|nr:aminoacyl-tRNA hydrolase [bacterium]